MQPVGYLLLCDDFSGIKLHEHRAVCFELLHWYAQPEIVEDEELELQMVELDQRESADLSYS